MERCTSGTEYDAPRHVDVDATTQPMYECNHIPQSTMVSSQPMDSNGISLEYADLPVPTTAGVDPIPGTLDSFLPRIPNDVTLLNIWPKIIGHQTAASDKWKVIATFRAVCTSWREWVEATSEYPDYRENYMEHLCWEDEIRGRRDYCRIQSTPRNPTSRTETPDPHSPPNLADT